MEICFVTAYFFYYKRKDPLEFALFIFLLNAFNLADGLDGLLISLFITGALTAFLITGEKFLLLCIFAAGVMLLINFPPAKMYLGDSGALFLGYTAFHFIYTGIAGRGFLYGALGISVIFLYPFLDTSWAVVRRLASRKPLFGKDDLHIHHRFRKKYGKTAALGILFLFNLVNNVIFFTVLRQLPLKYSWFYFIILMMNAVLLRFLW